MKRESDKERERKVESEKVSQGSGYVGIAVLPILYFINIRLM